MEPSLGERTGAAPPPRTSAVPVRLPVARPRSWQVLGLVLLVRILTMEVGSLAYIYLPHAWVESPPGTLPPQGSLLFRALVGLWTHWDGLWYLSIAQQGYAGRATATAFFPLYPLTIDLFGGTALSAVLAALVAAAAAYWILYRLASLEFGERVGWYTLLALAAFPTSFYLTAAYSESLFLALAAGSLYLARRRRYWPAGLAAALAGLVSTYGVLLVVPLAWVAWVQEGWRPRRYAFLALVPGGLLAYMAYLTPLFGDPLVFDHAQSNWGRHLAFFGVTLWRAAVHAWENLGQAISPGALFAPGSPSLGPSNVYNLLFALAVLGILIWATLRRRLPGYLLSYAWLALAVPLSYPAYGTPLMSMPRLALEVFPLFPALGLLLVRSRLARRVYFLSALPLAVLLITLYATAHWVA
ncbi:MAG: mannosyltransferase family protein [Firmicutes bacterium]|nr:mannosyltransferase family protein [Bacillota bacterium]